MQTYQIQYHPRSHNLKIKIEATGKVVVVAPRDCPVFFIDQFVKKHQDWIDKHLAQVQKQGTRKKKDDSILQVFGQNYTKKITTDKDLHIGVYIQGKDALIVPVTQSATSVNKSVENFLKSTAEKYIIPRTHQLGKQMGITFKRITLKAQKTRWGSCSSEGNLNFNWRLVHCPPEVIDYVIIHELSHRKHMNHSDRFWNLVSQYDPEYMKHRGWLKREGMDLG
jgi:predicted metal-dependent hydrolase